MECILYNFNNSVMIHNRDYWSYLKVILIGTISSVFVCIWVLSTCCHICCHWATWVFEKVTIEIAFVYSNISIKCTQVNDASIVFESKVAVNPGWIWLCWFHKAKVWESTSNYIKIKTTCCRTRPSSTTLLCKFCVMKCILVVHWSFLI
jgi:hypothetical protein